MKNYNLEHLNEILYEIKSNSTKNNLRFFHLNSVENFIFHFTSFKDAKRKEFIYSGLEKYLTEVANINYILDRGSSRVLYLQYLASIAQIYLVYKGFSLYVKYDILIYCFVAISLLLMIFTVPMYFYLILAIIFLIYIAYIEFKKKAKKVCGFYY